jgi:NAD(P)-dependent dehydrogenase (short-subunit alcohol dehydrogenase family)
VYLACRDERKANEAIRELEKDEKVTQKGELRFLHLDLGDFASAKRAGAEILTKEERLDILGAFRSSLEHSAQLTCRPSE